MDTVQLQRLSVAVETMKSVVGFLQDYESVREVVEDAESVYDTMNDLLSSMSLHHLKQGCTCIDPCVAVERLHSPVPMNHSCTITKEMEVEKSRS